MAARKKIRHDENTRNKIRAAQIINRLEGHVFGEIDLSSTQVSSAKVLLAKVLPDLQTVENTGEITQRIVSEKPLDPEDWAKQFET